MPTRTQSGPAASRSSLNPRNSPSLLILPRYRHQALADLTHLVLDPMMRDRIAIAHRTLDSKPLGEDDIAGIAIWASVSETVEYASGEGRGDGR
jgi:hypothetical protein